MLPSGVRIVIAGSDSPNDGSDNLRRAPVFVSHIHKPELSVPTHISLPDAGVTQFTSGNSSSVNFLTLSLCDSNPLLYVPIHIVPAESSIKHVMVLFLVAIPGGSAGTK